MTCNKCGGISHEQQLLIQGQVVRGITCAICGMWTEIPPPVAMPDYVPERNVMLQEIGRRRAEWGGAIA